MNLRAAFVLPLLFLAWLAAPAEAWLPHGTPSGGGTCPYGIDNGCAAANQSAQIIFPTFFTTVRQSGQGQYKASGGAGSNHPPTFNVPAVDYPVGQITVDASLKDPLLYLGTADFTGCNFNIPLQYVITCGSGAHNFTGYRWNGVGLFISNSSGDTTFVDNHITLTSDNCRNFNGSANLRQTSGALTITNNRFDFDSGCVFNAGLYKNSGDPGLVTQASFTASITASSMTVASSSVGKIRVGQFLDFPGRAVNTTISSLTAPAAVTISAITISGTTATVTTATPHGLDVGAGISLNGQTSTGYRGNVEVTGVPDSTHFTYTIAYYQTPPAGSATVVGTYSIVYLSGAAANNSVWAVSGATSAASGAFTTGPIIPTLNGPVTGGSADLDLRYNAIFGASQFLGTGTSGNISLKYNYEEIATYSAQHNNMVFNTPPGAPITIDITFEGNNVWWPLGVTDGNYGTGLYDLFTSSAAASTSGPQTVDNWNVVNNIAIANKSTVGGHVTNAFVRYLGQKGNGPDIKYTMAGGVLTVTQFASGSNPTIINAGNVVQCTVTNCNHTVQFIAQLTGTGGAPCPDVTCTGGIGTYSVTSPDTVTNTAATSRVSNYNGTINTINVNGNFYDPTAVDGVYNTDPGNTNVGATNSTGNVNMLTGASCNVGGSC